MNITEREPTVSNWEQDGEFIQVAFVRDNGERVTALYQRWGWVRPPSEVIEDTLNTLSKGPRRVVGRQG